jgi:hypothetical protein
MRSNIILLRIAGIISLLFMVFHFAFYSLFKWENELECLSTSDRAIMLTYHAISILVTGFMGLIPLAQTRAILNSSLKYSVLSLFSLFYLFRIIAEFFLFGYSNPSSPIILIFCCIPLVFYFIPIVNGSKSIS